MFLLVGLLDLEVRKVSLATNGDSVGRGLLESPTRKANGMKR